MGAFLPTTRRVRNVRAIQWARYTETPPKLRRTQRTAAMKAGIKYEKQVQDVLQEYASDNHIVALCNPWFQFRQVGPNIIEYCQMDMLLVGRERVTIVEVKHTHCLEAWHQLYNLYTPVYLKARKQEDAEEKPVHRLEVVRWFDPLVVTPHEPHRVKSVDDTLENEFNVMVIK